MSFRNGQTARGLTGCADTGNWISFLPAYQGTKACVPTYYDHKHRVVSSDFTTGTLDIRLFVLHGESDNSSLQHPLYPPTPKTNRTRWVCRHTYSPRTQEAETGTSLKFGSSRSAWASIARPHLKPTKQQTKSLGPVPPLAVTVLGLLALTCFFILLETAISTETIIKSP